MADVEAFVAVEGVLFDKNAFPPPKLEELIWFGTGKAIEDCWFTIGPIKFVLVKSPVAGALG